MKAFYLSKTALTLLCIFLTAGKLWAQFEEGKSDLPQINKIQCTAGNSYQPATVTIFPTLGESARTVQNIIRFQFDELAHTSTANGAPLVYFKSAFTATATVSVDAWRSVPSSGTMPPDATFSLTLVVTYDPAAGAKYNPVAYRLLDNTTQGYQQVKATLSPVQVSGLSNGWTANDVLPLLSLQNDMRVLRYFTNPSLPAPSFNTPVNQSDQLSVSWTFPTLANTSQLEYAWTENETKDYYNVNGTFNTDRLFRENSTRVDIDTSNQVFNIPLLFDANTAKGGGTLYYRVRSVYRKNDGSVITGDWSSPQTFTYSGHEPNLNWQSTTSFAENGKSKMVIQYFDGSLRPRQTVTKDNTTGNTTVAETIYDLQGRPSIQILPTPTINGAIAYAKDFNRFAGQTTNDDPAKYFDLAVAGNQCNGAPQLNTAYGNGAYYSPANPWKNTESEAKFIPDANGYAFTQTRYTDDPTQRVSSQGGVGAAHQIGGTHTTDYYYGKPGQDELDALFGTEVGDASHYFKNMVKDANGQMSVSYVDMHGRTVATALAGDSTVGINAIYKNTAFYPSTSGQITSSLVTPSTNVVKGNLIENISTLLVPATTAYQFTYQLVPDILQQADCNGQPICFDCKYDLDISIRQEGCNTAPIIRHYSNLQIVPASQACGTPMGFTGTGIASPVTQINFSETLGIGSWVVRKTLSLNDSLFAIRHDSAMHAFLCKTQQDITDSVFAAMSATSSCALPPASRNCDACRAALGDNYAANNYQYRQNFIASSGGSTMLTEAQIHALYTQDSLDCANVCGLPQNPVFSTLNNIRDQMLEDVTPYTGQYALSVDSMQKRYGSTYQNTLTAKFSVITPADGTYGHISGETKPYYKNPDGLYNDGNNPPSPDLSIYPAGTPGSSILPTLSADDFTGMFNRNWAEQLLYFHPESGKLLYAQNNLAEVYAWQDRVMQCNTYAGAADSGYLNPMYKDPYFKKVGSSSADYAQMNRYLNITVNDNLPYFSIWRLANGAVLCDSTLPSSEYSACLTGNTNDYDGMDNDIVTTAQKDAFWRTFKTTYLGYRNEMVTAYLNTQTASTLDATSMGKLQDEDRQLRFATNAAVAKQNGWTWWSYATSANPDQATLNNMTQTYVLANTTDKCVSQRFVWQSKLEQCEVLQSYLAKQTHEDSLTDSTIINLILDSMVMVCHNSIDANNPYGASNVNPALMPKTPANFEDIVNHVFAKYNIATLPDNHYFCNPYSVDYPKPYGSNPPVYEVKKASVDTCNCQQFAALKASAKTAGYDTASLSSLNQYLLLNYGDTLSVPLWLGLQQCSTHSWYGAPTCYWKKSTYLHDPWNTSNATANKTASGPTTSYQDPKLPDPCDNTPSYGIPHIDSVKAVKPSQSTDDGGNQTLTIYYRLPSGGTSTLMMDESTSLGIVTGTSKPVNLPQCERHTFYIVSRYAYTDCHNTQQEIVNYSNEVQNSYCWTKDSCTIDFVNIPLGSLVTIPPFLSCGYSRPCITCDQLQVYTAAFRQLYPAYSSVPYTTGVDTAQAKQNALWARYLNYKTGFSKTANEYIIAGQSCGTTTMPTVPANLVLTSRTTQPPSGATQPQSYTAGSTITFDDGYVSSGDDYFQTLFDTTGSGSGSSGGSITVLCAFDKPVTYVALPDTAAAQKGSCAAVQQQADFIGVLLFQQRKDSLIANFDSLYRAKCLGAQRTEVFSVAYTPKEYHYTLYYYDEAGNLVKTMPPAAVKPDYSAAYLASVKTARAAGTDQSNPLNNEAMATQYRYNTLNAVVAQSSPDGGTSGTWYDRLGRLAVSQNAKQKAANNYSYTVYDPLGRITEVGQKPQTTGMTQTISGDTTALKNWLSSGGTKEQITRTVYDEAYPQGIISGYVTQLNLRNRVSYVQAIDVDNNNVPPYRTATFYSYDVHGNADTVLHDYGSGTVMDVGNNRFKLIRYDYDLISGKVNLVSYQPHNSDGYYQQYRYDAENRLISVWTSRDSILWQQDATYHYYRHGPLARLELGDLKVQGVDYAYTLEGALKGINSTSVGDGSYDMGEDGKANSSHSYIPRDAFGMSIDYYAGDYVPVSSSVTPFTSAGISNNLYNGNIKASIVNIPSLGSALAYAYQYDQLNRLTGMDVYTGLNNSSNTFNPTTNGDYKERLTYDPNGNILSYLKNGAGSNQSLNNYSYAYVANKNQLQSIFNSVTQQTKTYAHDLIGNITDDGMQGVQSGQWDLYNRVQTLQNKDGKTVTYTYDANGYRISKKVGNITEWYVRTADGNILATYVQGDNTKNSGALTQSEVHLYGSSELGIVNSSTNCGNLTMPLQNVFSRVEKNYEISDPKENVIVVISDKRIQHTTDNTTVDYSTTDVISANYYSAFGAISKTLTTSTTNGYNGQRRSNEISATAQTARFWEYNGDVGRRWNIDPKPNTSVSGYASFDNNPILMSDRLGDSTNSTHIDQSGKVIAVYFDGDFSIYKHQTAKTQKAVDKWRQKFHNTSGNGIKIGETLTADAFYDEDARAPEGSISLNSKEGLIFVLRAWADISSKFSDDFGRRTYYAINAGMFDKYDFKREGVTSASSQEDVLQNMYKGSILMYKNSMPIYASRRDFGNYFAGYVASSTHEDKREFLQTAGAFNYFHNDKYKLANSILSHFSDVPIKWPTYGEDIRSNYFQRVGYHKVLSIPQLKSLGSKLWQE